MSIKNYISKYRSTTLYCSSDKELFKVYSFQRSKRVYERFLVLALSLRKLVYQATTKELAEDELIKLDEKRGKKYPIVLQSWNNKWENLSYYFKYPYAIRKIMYTTNIIESVHRQFRKLTA